TSYASSAKVHHLSRQHLLATRAHVWCGPQRRQVGWPCRHAMIAPRLFTQIFSVLYTIFTPSLHDLYDIAHWNCHTLAQRWGLALQALACGVRVYHNLAAHS